MQGEIILTEVHRPFVKLRTPDEDLKSWIDAMLEGGVNRPMRMGDFLNLLVHGEATHNPEVVEITKSKGKVYVQFMRSDIDFVFDNDGNFLHLVNQRVK